MILFPDCKINIGLDVICRRPDGFHEIETLLYPVRGLCDALEMVKSPSGFTFTSSGLALDCPARSNICLKACELMARRFGIGGLRIHLHKHIPFGAGLGGGSADGAFVIKGINAIFGLGLTDSQMADLAGEIGSDTPFFIRDTPQIARGRGEVLSPSAVSLAGKRLLIVKPPLCVSTAEAYSGIEPGAPHLPLSERLSLDISQWRGHISNAFEKHIFEKYPLLGRIKAEMYALGAEYASMSGSGSAIYGIFAGEPPRAASAFRGMFVHSEVMA